MIHPYWEAGGKRLDVVTALRTEESGIAHFLATVIIVNACIAVAFGIFYELVKLCLQLGASPWWTAVTFVGAYAAFLVKECRTAAHHQPDHNGE